MLVILAMLALGEPGEMPGALEILVAGQKAALGVL
jgi:hypothetical protein